MDKEINSNLQIAGSEAYERLKKARVVFDFPYGDEFNKSLIDFFIQKMMRSVDGRIQWLVNDLKLNFAKRGYFDFEGAPIIVAKRLLYEAANHETDYVLVLKVAVLEMQENGEIIPQNFLSDFQLARDWINAKYGLNL